MQAEEIREVLRRKEGGKIDSYVLKNSKKRAAEVSLMNVLQVWAHALLYYKQIYPAEAFVERSLLGVTVIAASSPPLKDYLDGFFSDLKPHLPKINHLQIVLVTTSNSLLQTNTLHIQDLEQSRLQDEENIESGAMGSLQKDIQFKSFLYDLKNSCLRGFVRQDQEVSFRLRVGYRVQQGDDPLTESIAQDWLKRSKIAANRREILSSLKWPYLNVIYELGCDN